MIRTGLFHIVAHERVDNFHRAGWMIVTVLGEYSCLMWRCDCSET